MSAQRASASSVGLLVAKRRADGLARGAAGGVVSVLRRAGPGTASRRRLGAAGLDLRELDRLGGLGVLPLGCGRGPARGRFARRPDGELRPELPGFVESARVAFVGYA